jgi:chromosomal replication initiator protein
MSLNKATGRKLQILSGAYEDPRQLDLLSFVSEQLGEFSAKEKPARVSSPKVSTPKIASYHFHGNVDSNKSFANFCVGKSNQFAVEAIKRFISSEKTDFGLIFLKAASGLGKSHLLHAVGNEMLSLKKSFYFSSPLMMSPLVDTFSMLKFYDILLIDDIEEIEGNAELQKIFCQLMDFASAGKIKLIIAGAKLPKDLNGCDERTKGKLSAALFHHIDEMNSDLAFDIVESKSTALNLNLPEGVKRLVSNQIGFNVYGVESLLYKFKNASDIKGQKITMEMALEEIKVKKVIYRSDDFHNFLSAVATTFEISLEELMSSVRKKEFALARHVAMYVLKDKKRLGVMKIAELFERDHSSVVHAIARIKKQLESDQDMKSKVQALLSEV